MQLYQHQVECLKETENQNHVAVDGYEGLYEVDALGNVYSKNGRLKPCEKNGYLSVNLYKDGCNKHYYIHRLVATAFIDKPDGCNEVNHINCDKHDNRAENLEWCNRTMNLQHSYENGLKRMGEKHGRHKLSEGDVREIRREYVKGDRNRSLHALGDKYGVNWCTIQAIIKRRLWKEVM